MPAPAMHRCLLRCVLASALAAGALAAVPHLTG